MMRAIAEVAPPPEQAPTRPPEQARASPNGSWIGEARIAPAPPPWRERSRAERGRRRILTGARFASYGRDTYDRTQAGYSPRRARPRTTSGSDMSLFRFLLRWSWVVALMTVLGGVGGYGYLQYGPLPYKSTATLMLRPMADPSGLPQVTANPQRSTASALAIAAQAAAPSVYEATSRALLGQMDISSNELATLVQNGRIMIAPVGGSSFITVTASDPDPSRAWLLADGYARGLMLDLAAQARLVTEQQQADLRTQATVLQQQLISVPLNINSPGAADTYSAVHARILQRQMDIEAQLLAMSQSGPPVARHGETADPALAISPSRVLIAGAAAGGTFGLMLAYLFELVRQMVLRRAHTRQLARATARPSTIPTPPVESSHAPGPVSTAATPNDRYAAPGLKGGRPRWAGSARV